MLMSNREVRNLIMSIRIRIGKNGAESRKWYGNDTPMYHAYMRSVADVCREIDKTIDALSDRMEGIQK